MPTPPRPEPEPEPEPDAADADAHARNARLPATAWAVLGILSFGEELTGYEVRQWADHILRFFYWSPAMSQIYSELKRLEKVGYAASRELTAEDGRSRRVYGITDTGRAALAAWVGGAPVEPPVLKHGPMLRVWLGHLADPDRLREVVTRHRDDCDRLLKEAEHSRGTAARVPGWSYPELVARWAARHYAAERDLADRLLADLDELASRR
ncbi:PadR family transcriptional regulator [Actinomadura kijaniata]|uniref:PadR family transcriptional regulator n=1 Tax=Actinomadura kijaniata TaxID=46161 RepID=UPI000A06FD54|nr:PadR family transcriptional regulator [Actinomadura kijaniata]